MIKKMFGLILCILLIISSIPSYAQNRVIKLNNDKYKLLNDLGFLPPVSEDEIDFEGPCTRADFAYMLHAAAGYERVFGKTKENIFTDVSDSKYYAVSVNNLAKAGVVSGTGESSFNPLDTISFNQAVKMVVVALGYGEYANYRGGYPVGYLACAKDIDILANVTNCGNEPLSFRDALNLIANACDAKILEVSSVGDSVSYSNTSGQSLISRFLHIKKYEGRVMGTSEIMFSQGVTLDNDEVLIGDKIYKSKCSFIGAEGCNVYYYFDEYTQMILSYVPINEEITFTEIDSENVLDFENGNLKYIDGDRECKIKVSQFADIAYNGRPCTDIKKEDFTSVNGKIKLINNGSKDCDAVIISDAKVIVVGRADALNEVIYDKYTNTSFSVKDIEFIFKDQFGNDMSVRELGEYDVISVYVSKDGKYATLYSSNREAEGKLNEISKKDGKTYVVIGNREYVAGKSFESVLESLPIGTEGIFPLDTEGNVAAVKLDDNANRWGWFIDCKTQSGLSGNIRVKFFTEKGEILTTELDDRVIIDDKSYKKEEAYKLLSQYCGVIRYRLSDSKLKFVETPNNAEKINKLYAGYDNNQKPSSSLRYLSGAQTFGGKVAYDSKTIIFEVPALGINDDSIFRLKSFSELINEQFYYFDAYRLGTDAHCADILVYFNDKKTSQITPLTDVTIIDYVSEVLNENYDEVYAIHGFRGGVATIDYTCDKTVIDNLKGIAPGKTEQKHILKAGDVVKLGYNLADKTVEEVNICYDYENDYLLTNANIANNWDGNRMIRTFVYSEDNGNLWLTQEDLSAEGVELGIESIESVFATKYKIYRIRTDNEGKTIVEKASVSDIMDYKKTGSDCSEIIMFSRNWYPGTIVILK